MLLKFTKDKVVIQNIENIDVIYIETDTSIVNYIKSSGEKLSYDLSEMKDMTDLMASVIGSLRNISVLKEIEMNPGFIDMKGILYFVNRNKVNFVHVPEDISKIDPDKGAIVAIVFDNHEEIFRTKFEDNSELEDLYEIHTTNAKTVYDSYDFKNVYAFFINDGIIHCISKFGSNYTTGIKGIKLTESEVLMNLFKRGINFIKFKNPNTKDNIYYNLDYIRKMKFEKNGDVLLEFSVEGYPELDRCVEFNI